MVNQAEINAHFIEIIQFLKSEYGYTQEYIVEKAKLGKSAISKIKNGENNVGDKTINKICDAFKQLNPDYFYGRSPYKTIREKKEAEMEEELKKTQDYITHMDDKPTLPPSFEFSLMIEHAVKAATAYADQTIATLKSQLADKDKMLADKDDIIATLKSRIRDLERTIAAERLSDIDRYPFSIGAAEGDKQQTNVNNNL